MDDESLKAMPGNLKKSYIVMEILDDQVQQKIMRLRSKQENRRCDSKNNQYLGWDNAVEFHSLRKALDAENECVSSSRRFVGLYRKPWVNKGQIPSQDK